MGQCVGADSHSKYKHSPNNQLPSKNLKNSTCSSEPKEIEEK